MRPGMRRSAVIRWAEWGESMHAARAVVQAVHAARTIVMEAIGGLRESFALQTGNRSRGEGRRRGTAVEVRVWLPGVLLRLRRWAGLQGIVWRVAQVFGLFPRAVVTIVLQAALDAANAGPLVATGQVRPLAGGASASCLFALRPRGVSVLVGGLEGSGGLRVVGARAPGWMAMGEIGVVGYVRRGVCRHDWIIGCP